MDATTRYGINSQSIVNEIIDGEVVMINLDTGSYYSADKTGAALWSMLMRGATLPELVGAMTRRFEGAAGEIERAVVEFLERLKTENIIVPMPNGGAAPLEPADTISARAPFQKPTLERYDDMQDLLLADPIHDVPETGWPYKSSPSDSKN